MALGAVLIWIPQPVYDAVGSFMLAQWRMLLTGLVAIALAGITGSTLATLRRPTQVADSDDEAKPLLREMPEWAIWAGMAGLVAIGLLATWWLVTTYGSGDAKTIEQNRIKLEAIKLAASVVVGTGSVAALLLAARRQRVSELDLLQRDRVADINRHDADERRATELYTAAAEQLASDKAPVRMAGMYALSRLGERNGNLRKTIINLLCAYLRMPETSMGENGSPSMTAPDHQKDGDTPQRLEKSPQPLVLDLASAPLAALKSLAPDLSAQQQQEHQVRLTAQRLLAQHLRPNRGEDGNPKNPSFWPDMDIDLAGASLHEWDFSDCEVRSADFAFSQFHGDALFSGAQFQDAAFFSMAQFHGYTSFDDAQFHHSAWIDGVQFNDATTFTNVQFHHLAFFGVAQFHYGTPFDNAQFHRSASFEGTEFHGHASFRLTQFNQPLFDGAQFYKGAIFDNAKFHFASFGNARFHGQALFSGVQFYSRTQLGKVLFDEQPIFERTWVRFTEIEEKSESTWPAGWTVNDVDRNDGRESSWAQLARLRRAPEKAVES